MADLRTQVVALLRDDSTFTNVAQGGIWPKPIIPPKQDGWETQTWDLDPGSTTAGSIRPVCSVTDTDEVSEANAQIIHGTEATLYLVFYGPPHDGGKTAIRQMKERAYELLTNEELWLDVEGRGIADLEWRGSTRTADSDRLPMALEAMATISASYLKRV